MFNKKLKDLIVDESLSIKTKIDNFVQQTNSLMNKQELLLKAINEDRLVITKILEHLETLEKNEDVTNNYLADHTNRIAELEKKGSKK